MRHFILILFVLLPFCLFSQVNENFDGTELSADWFGKDREQFCINDAGRLQLNITPTDKDTSAIGREIPYSTDMQWEFDVYMQQAPSNQNKLCVYLYQENADRFYYVRIGNMGTKELSLRRHGEVELVPPKTDFETFPSLLRVKVTLEDNRYWSLYYQTDEMSGYQLEGQAEYSIEESVESGILNFTFYYSKNQSALFSIDNIRISHQITDTPSEPDEPPVELEDLPELEGIELLSLSSLRFDFDKAVDKSEAVFSISEIGDAYITYYVDADTKRSVSAFFDEEMQPGKYYTVSYSGLKSLSGAAMPDFADEYELGTEEEEPEPDDPEPSDDPEAYPVGSVLINEVMAKPGDGGMVEYIELYNTLSELVKLSGWEYRNVNGKKTKMLPDITLPSGGYAVLLDEEDQLSVPQEAVVIRIEKFPALNDNGSTLQLWDATGNQIDEITYEKATATRSWERSASGWHLSSDPRGGTPGETNSSPEEEEPEEPIEEPDEPENPEEPEEPIETDPILPGEIVFNELLPDPYAGGSEYFELYNRSEKPLPVFTLSVAVRKTDGTLSTRYPLSAVKSFLETGGYLLLTKSVDAVTSFYPIEDEDALCEMAKLPVLANTASTLVLFRTADGVVIDEVAYTSKWHAPSIKNKKGVALERINPEGATQDSKNWTSASALAGYGTPGYRNSQYGTGSSDEPTAIEAPVWIEETGNYTIAYWLDRPGYSCRALVFSITGKRVAEISNHQLLGTSGQLTWDGCGSGGTPLAAGVYIFYAEIYHPDGTVKPFKKVFLVR